MPAPCLYRQLERYCASGVYPFHMPGHKRRAGAAFMADFPNPYAIDITEIEGFDNLHHAEGILRESMDWAASIYGADRTYYLVNGSTCGVLSAICAAVEPERTMIMARNSHKSAYHAAALNRLRVRYVYPQIIGGFGLQGGLRPEDVENALREVRGAGAAGKHCGRGETAVFVTSPTYDGVVSDIRGIAEICHRYGAPLLVDEAHGAHFSFGAGFPISALDLGADVVIQSLHKTLPALTQSAVLHVRGGLVDVERLEYELQVFQSSSPSYVLMAGIERCIEYMAGEGRREMERFAGRLAALRRSLGTMRRLRLLGPEVIGRAGVFDLDRSKIVVAAGNTLGRPLSVEGAGSRRPPVVKGAGNGSRRPMAVEGAGKVSWRPLTGARAGNGPGQPLSGAELSARLRREYHLEMEMYGAGYVTAITTLMDTDEGLQRLAAAFLEIDRSLEQAPAGALSAAAGCTLAAPPPACAFPIHEAISAPSRPVPVGQSAGRISAEYVYLYPPGTPILVPGEVISREIADIIRAYRDQGLPVQGLRDHDAARISVLQD